MTSSGDELAHCAGLQNVDAMCLLPLLGSDVLWIFGAKYVGVSLQTASDQGRRGEV
jgi:hypothetical protein